MARMPVSSVLGGRCDRYTVVVGYTAANGWPALNQKAAEGVMNEVVIYHNPRCSKSREALAWLRERGIEPRVVLYMEQGLEVAEVRGLLQRLGIGARELLRSSESAYRERGLADAALSETSLLRAICEEPRLLQRPLVLCGEHGVIARPAERAADVLA